MNRISWPAVRWLGVPLLVAWTSSSSLAQQNNPFDPAKLKPQYERNREYDLQHVLLRLKVNWPHKTVSGRVIHTLSPLRDHERDLSFDVGPDLKVSSCAINGGSARFEQSKDKLVVHGPTVGFRRGAILKVTIAYSSTPPSSGRRSLNGSYGFHWILPDKYQPERRPGFYTQGESEGNHEWVPIYDYPNDKTTSETLVEVPEDWFVVGNGSLVGDTANRAAHTRTFHWKMTQPHATYLLSLAAGQMDVMRGSWEGAPLLFCVPRGEGKYIPASFGDTKDMLSFFSSTFGVKYPWPKYAQTCMFDFGGGMENVSATTLGEGSLVDRRSGTWPMASLNSHELSHQWFGDLVTCRNWSDIWLNEGFATFCEEIYLEHSRGEDQYDQEREGALQSYLFESRRYKRPIVTKLYPNPDSMFDSHTYPKGGLVLHMLRRELGDADFFRALGYYLNKFRYKPVETIDLVRAIGEATGRNVEPFFDQWVYKPGHPVIDYSWSYDGAKGEASIDISQQQDTKDGTPIYSIRMPVAVIAGTAINRTFVMVDKDKQTVTIPSATKPDAVLLDPGHDILMERKPKAWQPGEAETVVRQASCWLDRRDAAFNLLKDEPADAAVRSVAATLGDPSALYRISVVRRLGSLNKPYLRDSFRRLIGDPDPEVRSASIFALGNLASDPADIARLRPLVNGREMYVVVRAAINALSKWDPDGSVGLLRDALKQDSLHETIRTAAMNGLAASSREEAMDAILPFLAPSHVRVLRNTAVSLLGYNWKGRPRGTEALVRLLKDADPFMERASAAALGARGDKSAIPALQAAAKDGKDEAARTAAKEAAEKLAGK